MDLGWLTQLLPIAPPVITALLGAAQGERGIRRRIRSDIEFTKELPDESKAKNKLLEHIERQIDELSRRERGSRDIPMLAVASLGSIGLGYLTYWLFIQETWWRWGFLVSAFFATVFLYGVFDSARIKQKGDSDEK